MASKLIGLICLLLVHSALSKGNSFTCNPLPVKGEFVTLKAKKPAMVFIHNESEANIWVVYSNIASNKVENSSSHLQSKKWSAIVLGKQSVRLTCIESKPGHEQQIPCQHDITVCQGATNQIFVRNTKKMPYWISENTDWSKLKLTLKQYGFEEPIKIE